MKKKIYGRPKKKTTKKFVHRPLANGETPKIKKTRR
tara:strand:+ start:241 stop:348 length:108 start_codon:yes stop_codon:yes gene_type:complete